MDIKTESEQKNIAHLGDTITYSSKRSGINYLIIFSKGYKKCIQLIAMYDKISLPNMIMSMLFAKYDNENSDGKGKKKDVIANAIHLGSPRSEGPFIPVNCGAIPGPLLGSELFGYEKGAFTGALSMKRGRFERADKGTILLDEIGEMPIEAQVHLLRVIQYREIERVGGIKRIPVDIRIIASTQQDR